MRFKKLEIFGFKSFASKTTIHFEPGVTAIVGPNGSGKTNVVDAVRWVLGEHNPRDIRAPRLEDVIFNGTDTRAPLSMAEVSLTIDNGQGLLPISFSEVAITRRVYRSGESEYFINQSPCRLKDITELFLGTGLGGGTYAIIEQGHIDMILSSKPEERRVPFEEASGVAKYLAKKHETMRRLDETEEHLVRIADIIGEVRRQVGALERAANKARQYKSQWEQLKSCEMRLASDELTGGRARHQQLQEALAALTAQRDALDTQKQTHMASLESANAAVSSIQARLQAVRTKVMECSSQIDQHRSQVALKGRWIDELTQQVQRIEQEAAQLRERMSQVDEHLARVSGGEGELQSQVAAVQGQLAQGQEELGGLETAVQGALAAMTAAKTQVFSAASEASHQRNELTQVTARVHAVDAQLARLEEQRTQRAAQMDDVARRSNALEGERQGAQTRAEEMQRRIDGAQQALSAADARRHELTGRLQQLREQQASERAKVKLLEDLWKRHEGFPETVKTLIGRGIDGVVAPLADLVQPMAGYEDVVEAALGPLADALVVRDRPALEQCRSVLNQEQLEACRFLVLSDCPSAAVALEQPSVQVGVSGSVRQYVRAEAAYQPLVDWVLNDSWVIDDIQRLLGNGGVPQGRLVSQRGDRWDRRSWRFGNTRAAAHSRLGRKQRWEHAQAYLQVVEQDVEGVSADAQQAEQAWEAALAESEAAKGDLGQLSPALHKLDAQLAQLAHESQRLEAEREAGRSEAEELAARRAESEQSRTALEQAVTTAEHQQQAVEHMLSQAQADKEAADSRRQQLLIAKAHVETMVQSLAERLAALQTRRQEIDADRGRLTQQLDDKTRQREDASARSRDLASQLQQHETETQRLIEERTRLEAEVEQVAQALRDEEARRDQVLPHVLAAEHELSSLSRRIQDDSQQLSERTFRRERLLERLRELYQIDEATLQAEMLAGASPLTDDQRSAMTDQVQKLRGKLDTMGPVSLGSVDEYDELKRRLEFLQTQQQDLTQAREDLKTSISQINRAARAQFKETFEKIKQEFQHYYTRLFNGGQADLILMDEEDVLECGIDIVARPPGKRLQSISLLSGGERALTAIALLFSLFKVRPSPFCILDEIDAPLDEANVDRFTKVLEEFLVLSQFILITHNKKTITKADSLYGVTMAEAGISQILSAKLTHAAAGG